MGLFRKKEKTVDWTERYFRQKDRMENLKEGIRQSTGAENKSPPAQGNFNFLANLASSSVQSSSSETDENSDERRRKLARRLMDLTEKIEELSTQLYHLQQRVEVLEIKNKTGFE